ncbi:MAG: hypothetical protein Q7R31_03665 [Candidatus Levybacteria bacterium]|nr:hypothetical protein [Candidatus Levybacteria bacterium]
MNHEAMALGEQSKEPRNLPLSWQVEQELRANTIISVVGIVKGTNDGIYSGRPLLINAKDNIPYNKILTSYIDIYCGLKTPIYDPEKLQAILQTLTQTKPTEVKPFGIANFSVRPSFDLDLGKAYYDEQLGAIVRCVKMIVFPRDAKLLQQAADIVGELEDESKIAVSQRTSIHLYPDENCARWMYEFARSPADWKERKDWYDPGEDFFSIFKSRIKAAQLKDLKAGENIFWEEESTAY